MAKLELIDEIVEEITKARGIDLPPVCIKILFLSYWLYCVNNFDIKYRNKYLKKDIRLNSGCIILCQKGTGKSLTLGILKDIFEDVEKSRVDRYEKTKASKVGRLINRMIPLSGEEKKELAQFEIDHGGEAVGVFKDTATSKSLCETYAMGKRVGINNILFSIDEAGDRIFKDAFSKTPSLSGKEFVSAINELFDGYCGMGQSSASKTAGIQSQHDVGANFIFVSTAEFLKDYHVQQRYKSSFEGGFARRLLYINCPPIDETKTNRKFYMSNVSKYKEEASGIIKNIRKGARISFNDDLRKLLEKDGSGGNISIATEFLLLIFCTSLAVWTEDYEINKSHWQYMLNLYKEIKEVSVEVVQHDTNTYDKICAFIKNELDESGKKKVHMAVIKDFCLRNKMTLDSKFRRWFDGLCSEFADANVSKYIIEKNKNFVWLTDNFAYEGDK